MENNFTAETLLALAERYETEAFILGDPSWFMHQVEGESNQELMAFVASCLSYGSRKQFLPKIERIMNYANGNMVEWISNGRFAEDIPNDNACFYRLYTNGVMHRMLSALREMLNQYGSMRGFVENLRSSRSAEVNEAGLLNAKSVVEALVSFFASRGIEGIVPKNATSSCKRICMFLRWMVRDGSPVDLGLWSDLIDKQSLLIPLDTHVMQEARKMGFITSNSTSMRVTEQLTERLRAFFPNDPVRADFALFGVGVDNEKAP